MMASTHAAIGVVVYAGGCALFGVPIEGAALGAAAIGSWLPDIDTPTSKAGFCVFPLALWMERRFGHRTITHSFFGCALFALLCAPLLWFWPAWGEAIFAALLCGYGSHLLADAATKSGVPLGWPNRRPWVFPGNEDYRVRTGSRAEVGVLFAFLLLGMLTIPVQRFGVRRLLHMATNSVGGAVRDVEDWSDYQQVAQVNGYDVLNQKVVEGTFPVVGRRDDGTLVVERDDGQHGYWLIKEGGSELQRIAPRAVQIERRGPSHSQTRSINVANLTLAALSRALVKASSDTHDFEEDTSDPSAPDKSADALGVDAALGLTPATGSGGPGLSGSVYLHRVLVSGAGECWPFSQDPAQAPLDVPQFGLKAIAFSGSKISFDFAQPHHIIGAGSRVAIRSAVLSVKMPEGATLPNLNFPTVRREITAGAMAHHADLLVRVGQLVARGEALNKTSGQRIKHEPTPEERDAAHAADTARRDLLALEVEEGALRRRAVTTWGELAPSYRARRRALEAAAHWREPGPANSPAPAPATAPFDCVVEAIEWEMPTTPTQKGERPENVARLTLVQVAR